MDKNPPRLSQIILAIGFTVSCFALLLFLWLAFGGPIPLQAEGYRVKASFNEATQLANESDIRISGVSVGKVKTIDLSEDGRADAVLEIDATYAPIPSDTKAILRQKTLLGETYVELTPGTEEAAKIPEDGTIPTSQIANSVQLDEIFRTFDEPTRAAFQVWMQDQSEALAGRGLDLNSALGTLDPFAEEAARTLAQLDSQRLAVEQLVRDGGEVFEALSERKGELRGLIENTDAVFSTTADRDAQLQDVFRILPTFQDESRLSVERLEEFANLANPLITQLRPAARELSPVLIETGKLAPELERFFDGLRPSIQRAPKGFKALRDVLDTGLPPLLGRLPSFLNELNPSLEVLRQYRRETTAFLGNVAAATNGFNFTSELPGERATYLRTTTPLGPEALAAYPARLASNRDNPYFAPGALTGLGSGLEVFSTGSCTTGRTATIDPGDSGAFPGDLFDRIRLYALNDQLSTDDISKPDCTKQAPFASIGGPPKETTDFLKVRPQP